MSDEIVDAYLRRSLTLLRAAEGEAIDSASKLRKIHKSIAKEISKTFGDNPSKRKIKTLQISINERLKEFYGDEFPRDLAKVSSDAVVKEIEWNKNFLSSFSEGVVISPIADEVIDRASKLKYQGKTLGKWIKNEYPTQTKAFDKILRNGLKEGFSIADIAVDLKRATGIADRNVKTLTRAYIMHNAAEAKEQIFKKNPKLIEGKIWVSTLDSRTTPLICGVRDMMLYNMANEPQGHTLPWGAGPKRIHWGCRSDSVPKLVGVPFVAPRPSVGAGSAYQRGDNVTNRGTVRKPTKVNREKDIFSIEMKTTRTRYEGWLKSQSRTNIDYVSDILGSGKNARLFRDGEVSLAQLSATSPVANPINMSKL